MKILRWLCVPLLLSGLEVSAQTTLTTYYTIPPVNGCDGLWAFGPASDLWGTGSCAGPVTYFVSPSGCAESPFGWPPFWISGDTVYSNLCSLPCDFQTWNMEGDLCAYCQVQVSIGMSVSEDPNKAFAVFPNPLGTDHDLLEVRLNAVGNHAFALFDAQGRLWKQGTLRNTVDRIDLDGILPGPYMLCVTDQNGVRRALRLVIQ